ncbi:MAG: GtrA family protein [Pontiellaceae bacterium]|nr:GtrA family protein [Pontiellaceae bacterium]
MEVIKKFITNKDHAGVQFFKYAACGCFALTVDMLVAFLIAWLWLPALKGTELFVKLFHAQCADVPEETRTVNFIIGSVIAFAISNLVAYILNVLFVFKAGKHSRLKEIGLFYAVSGISIGIGVALGALVVWLNFSYDWSYVTKALSAAMINYAVRKFFIFQG